MKTKIATIKARIQGLLLAFSMFSTLTSFGQQLCAAAMGHNASADVHYTTRLESSDSAGAGTSEGGSPWLRLFRQTSRGIKRIRSTRDNVRKALRVGRRLRETTGIVPGISCLAPLFLVTGRLVQVRVAGDRMNVSSALRTSVRRQAMSATHRYASAASHCRLATAM